MAQRRRYAVELTPSAQRDLARIPRADQQRVATRVDSLSVDPRPEGCKKLQGTEDLYRVRQGDYRIIYRVVDDPPAVTVARIRHRGTAYRGR